MHFMIGRSYRHNGGHEMTIVGAAHTHIWGPCLIGEDQEGNLVPVASDVCSAINWKEIPAQAQVAPATNSAMVPCSCKELERGGTLLVLSVDPMCPHHGNARRQ